MKSQLIKICSSIIANVLSFINKCTEMLQEGMLTLNLKLRPKNITQKD